MEFVIRILRIYWDGFLGGPMGWLDRYLHFDVVTPWKVIFWKAILTVAFFTILYEVYLRIRLFMRKKDDLLADEEVDAAYVQDDQKFAETLEAAQDLERTIGPLKKARKYDHLAQVYAALNKPKEAAKWFRKSGDPKRAAMEWAKAGRTLKAARLLRKAGDHATAARFFAEKGRHLQAAKSYAQMGDLSNAANAYAKAKKHEQAVGAFKEYFGTSKDEMPLQVKAAEHCLELLGNEAAKAALSDEERKELQTAVAQRFDAAQRNDLAARLFREAGQLVRAGEVYLRAGKLQEAAQCMKEAGRPKEAAKIGGRFYESKGKWKEAGMAYEGAEDFRQAGDCFSKALDAVRAASCYEKAGEFYGAGFALAHAQKWEGAIKMLQQVPEDNPNFAESRALLGRCFYELKAYEHCAAALENHLTGERVRTSTIDYFWMLALAYEQLGNLDKSRDVLLKIRSVNVGFRDVANRLSNIETRLSMSVEQPQSGMSTPTIPSTPAQPSGEGGAVMTMVENSLGARYRLERELGRGGMGVVYLARDTQLDRPVALKFLGSLVDGNEEFRQRFLREARAAAQVSHPNIVAIYDISASEGKAYIAMEYIDGPNLYKYLQRKGKLEPREAVNIVGQACSALDAIHQCGIVHRDIKPDNIVLAKGGLVKLMDFGLAKGHGARITGTNVMMGTPCYMAPEQIRAEEADARADIYAIGLVLHELLTGETVFAKGDVLQRQQVEVPDPPSATVEGVPILLDQIVMKCISKKREERFQSAKELVGYLRQVGK